MAISCRHRDVDPNGNEVERCLRDARLVVAGRGYCARHAWGAAAEVTEVTEAKEAVIKAAVLERERAENGETSAMVVSARQGLHDAVGRLLELGWTMGD